MIFSKPVIYFQTFLLLFIFCSNVNFAQNYEVYQTLNGHSGSAYNVRFSPDGKTLASTGSDGAVILWNVADGKMLMTLNGISGTPYEATFSHNGKLIAACGADGIAKVWETNTGKLYGTYTSRESTESFALLRQHVSFVCFSKDDKKIFFGGDAGYLMQADVSLPDKPSQFFGTTNNSDGTWYSSVTGGCVTSDGKFLLVSVGDHVMIFDIVSKKLHKKVIYANKDIPGLNDVVLLPDEKTFAAWAFDGNVIFWELETWKQIKKLQAGDEKQHSAFSFNADGSKMVTAAFRNLGRVWDMKKMSELQQLRGHSRIIRSARYSPREDIIATAGYDATVKLWKSSKPDVFPTPEITSSTTVKEEKPPVITPEKDKIPPVVSSDGSSFSETDLKEGATVNLKNIRFEQSTAIFLESSYSDLQKLRDVMKEKNSMRVRLLGHTDNQGSKTENYRLSLNRVEAVKKYLCDAGIAPERIELKAWGPDKPIADNRKEETRQLNRRVEVEILKMK